METLAYIVIVAIAVMLGLVIYGTIAKNAWGLNFRRVTCPNCGTEMPRVRTPASGKQAFWGGFTCPKCGIEIDKWGRRVST